MTAWLAAAAVVGLVARRIRLRRRRDMGDPRRELASVAMHLARGSRLGLTPVEALEQAVLAGAAPQGRESAGRGPDGSGKSPGGAVTAQLRVVCNRMRNGVPIDEALESWQQTVDAAPRRSDGPDPSDLLLFTTAARLGQRHGRGLGQVFDAVSATLIDRVELHEEVDALSSQARASVAVLCALPVFGLAMLHMTVPGVVGAFFGSPAGWLCLLAAGGLDLLAVWAGARLSGLALR